MKSLSYLLASVFIIGLLGACDSEKSNVQDKVDDPKTVENEEDVNEEPEEAKEEVNVELTDSDREKAKEKIGEIDNKSEVSSLMIDMALQKVNIGGSTDGIPKVIDESVRRIPMESPYIEYFMDIVSSIDMDPEVHNDHLSILKKWQENNFGEVDQDVRTLIRYLNEGKARGPEVEKKTQVEEKEYINKFIQKEEADVELTDSDREKAKEKIGKIDNDIVFGQLLVDMGLQKVNIDGKKDGIPQITDESFRRIPMESPYIEYFMDKISSIDMDTKVHNDYLSILKKWQENNFDEVDRDVFTIIKSFNEGRGPKVVKKTQEEEKEYIDKYLKE
ncbi:hypothetical protein J8TS2_39990 [Lederbergia ruris]|uniref:Lipoprotein n=1 Tax=Lederbergia ruris TaxID=217495 RepID=A0ABQ4KP21_9BACI|nr:DUF6241 domain-containing protein [Lederbergia ruris]GIN59680.1 hypothetical protein J8TS2_39990 [Lederbergia ruris]